MSALQKVNLGTAPAGVDGDAVRTAFIKDNANVDVLNAQTFLTSATLITTAQALTTAHIGKRVNINLGSPGTINLPSASTCAADQVTLLRNLGTTVVTLAITTGSGDTVSISKLNPGETALMDTDGLHTWTCLMRSRTNSDNETVNGNSTVVGNETVGGTLGVTGATTIGSTLGVTGAATLASLGVTGNQTVGGQLTAGSVVSGGNLVLNYAPGAQRGVNWSASNSPRWLLQADGSTESGSNAGSNLALAAFSDSGAFLFNPIVISRSTGGVAFSAGGSYGGSVTLNGTAWTSSMLSSRNSSASPWGVSSYCSFQGSGGCYIGRVDAPATSFAAWFFGTTGVGSITTNGSATAYNTASDYRLKTNYQEIKDAVDTLTRIKFYEGEFKSQPGVKFHYVIAHELQAVLDYAVYGTKDAVDEDGSIKPQVVDYSKLVPILGAGLQAALSRIEALEAKGSA